MLPGVSGRPSRAPALGDAISADHAVSLRSISKAFYGSYANRHIDLDVEWGEIHALLGENGAGKTTLVKLLAKQPGQDEEKARAMLLQVKERDYNPPRRERILEWQAQQDFPICPTPEDPQSCNVYSELRFPEGGTPDAE